ncbi:MAG: hypothetical protein ACJ0GF_01640 [Burkholderiales bacterium]
MDRITEDIQQSAKIGIQGVPFFIINPKNRIIWCAASRIDSQSY